ncbi:MAG: cell wall-binding repeat-containing protein, partial [Acidimicrobiales bacterium]
SQGQAVFSADGDSGSEDCFFSNGDPSLQVDYPSSSPWVTAVGGTSRSLNGAETAWNGCDGVAANSGCAPSDGAGGGGTSTVEPKPFWQGAPNPPSASCGSHGANCRQTPDVSADAGVPVVFYTGGSWAGFIGTSIGAPLDAGIWADRAQQCGQGSPGDAAPTLYEIAATGGYAGAIGDITTGSNDLTGTHGGSFTAGPGYDLATGLGSLNAAGVGCTQAVSVTPPSAPGGSQVTVHGFGLQNATISFGGVPAQVLSATGSSALVVVPSGSGTVSVVATGPVASAASPASFTYGAPTGLFTRVFGQTAIGTAVATSLADFPTAGSANAVVLARDDFFSDALAGGPLAAAQGGPVLITESPAESANLDPAVQAEIARALKPGGTVYLLGGTLALSSSIDTTLQGMGFKTVRLAGNDEYATAVQIAQQLGNPGTVFEATGLSFADALSAVPAAVMLHGAILLTQGPVQNAETATYLEQHPSDHRDAIGGPLAAAGADPGAQAVFGNDLYATSAAVAATFFPTPTTVGAATGTNFP